MDLTKILGQNNSQLPLVTLVEQGKIFFANLLNQLQSDLQFIQTQPQLAQYSYFNKTRVLHGNLDENMKKMSRDASSEKSYLFLQLPNTPGFLIESAMTTNSVENGIYKMYRATKVNPILNTATGETMRPEIFVLKSGELEEFRVLDDCFVRTTTSDRTLSVKQMSEMLLLLAESVRL